MRRLIDRLHIFRIRVSAEKDDSVYLPLLSIKENFGDEKEKWKLEKLYPYLVDGKVWNIENALIPLLTRYINKGDILYHIPDSRKKEALSISKILVEPSYKIRDRDIRNYSTYLMTQSAREMDDIEEYTRAGVMLKVEVKSLEGTLESIIHTSDDLEEFFYSYLEDIQYTFADIADFENPIVEKLQRLYKKSKGQHPYYIISFNETEDDFIPEFLVSGLKGKEDVARTTFYYRAMKFPTEENAIESFLSLHGESCNGGFQVEKINEYAELNLKAGEKLEAYWF